MEVWGCSDITAAGGGAQTPGIPTGLPDESAVPTRHLVRVSLPREAPRGKLRRDVRPSAGRPPRHQHPLPSAAAASGELRLAHEHLESGLRQVTLDEVQAYSVPRRLVSA